MKLVFLVVLGLCAFQQFEARTVEAEKVGGIIDDIEKILTDIKQVIVDFAQFVQNAVQKAWEKLEALIDEIEKEIEEIEKQGEKERKCVEDHRQEIVDLNEKYRAAYQKCEDEADEAEKGIDKAYDDLKQSLHTLLHDFVDDIKHCFTDSGSVKDWYSCMRAEKEKIKPKYDDLKQKASEFITRVKTDEPKIVDDYDKCTDAADQEANTEFDKIIDEINKCIDTDN